MTRIPKRLAAALLAAAALGTSGSALAQETASAWFDNFTYHVVDLDPNDGITAGVTLSDNVVSGFARFATGPVGCGCTGQIERTIDSPGTVSIDEPGVHLSGTIAPFSSSDHVSIDHGNAFVLTDSLFDIVLAPNTQVTFSITGNTTGMPITPEGAAFGSVSLETQFPNPDGSFFGAFALLESPDGIPSGTISVVARSGADGLGGRHVARAGTGAGGDAGRGPGADGGRRPPAPTQQRPRSYGANVKSTLVRLPAVTATASVVFVV